MVRQFELYSCSLVTQYKISSAALFETLLLTCDIWLTHCYLLTAFGRVPRCV